MPKVSLTEGIYWVGAVDWNIREFHSYSLHNGTTYNAYLIVDDRIALVDTVKPAFYPEMRQRIREIVDPKDIDYVISNHVEMDHSGALPRIMEEAKRAQIVTSEKFGESGLAKTFHRDWPLHPVKKGNEIKLGKRTLTFIPIPMLHWPDSMSTYVVEDGLLLPNDAFGQHIASSERFDDEVGREEVMSEATKYYATILMPFGSLITRTLEELKGLKINMIGPSHGVIWRSYVENIISAYGRWGRGEANKKALVIYDTMWGSTEKMAHALVEGLAGEGVEVKLYNLTQSDRSDVIKEVLEAKVLLVGSATLNNGLLPSVAAFLSNIKGLKPSGKIGAAFGSYGWGGGAVKQIEQELKEAGVEVLDLSPAFKFVPDQGELAKCVDLGKAIAQKIK